MRKSKKPRFFCDNCGQEIDIKAKSCPHCGRFFASILCPACGFSGEDKLFLNGCPSCGYSEPAGKRAVDTIVKGILPGWAFLISILVLLALVAVLAYFITH